MFQDDRMISFLTAIVVMITIGTVVQRSDGVSDFFSPPKPAIVLVEDSVPAVAGKLRRIDVFANDENVTLDDRISLQIARQPSCGQVFIQGDVLQYLASHDCAGRQTLSYTIEGIEPAIEGEVVAFVKSDLKRITEEPEAEQPAPKEDLDLALSEDPIQPKKPEPQQPTLAEVLGAGAADTANAATSDEAQQDQAASGDGAVWDEEQFGLSDSDQPTPAKTPAPEIAAAEEPALDATLALIEPNLVEPRPVVRAEPAETPSINVLSDAEPEIVRPAAPVAEAPDRITDATETLAINTT
ncbi:MAG: hypothetical protein AAGF56_15230, partial [Pseudomonadota bacterium]